jgi:hypothetical protein
MQLINRCLGRRHGELLQGACKIRQFRCNDPETNTHQSRNRTVPSRPTQGLDVFRRKSNGLSVDFSMVSLNRDQIAMTTSGEALQGLDCPLSL